MNLKNIGLISAALLTTTTSSSFAAKSRATEKPNVIFILLDDVSSFATSTYGAREVSTKNAKFNKGNISYLPISTPNLDRLAREGVVCNHAYAHALSEPTRIALMTGMHGGRNFLTPKALHESQITFSDVFKREGYATAMYGKWKQTRGTSEIPGDDYISTFGWDDYACFDVVKAAQRYINPDLVVNDEEVLYHGRTDLDPKTGRRWYGPDIFNDKALTFIEQHKDEPFFLYYPMVLIHSEHRPTPDSEDRELFDTMPERQTEFNDLRYLTDMVSYADKMTGRVIDKLEELNLRENTLIVVMGDNGSTGVTFNMSDGTVHVGGKGRTNYAGEQVPLIFSRPGTIPASGGNSSKSYDPVVDLTDIYPTIIKASGLEIPNESQIDGVNLWDQLTGKSSKPHRETLYKWYLGNRSQGDEELLARYSHNRDYKYYAPSKAFPEGRFFDLKLDPREEGGVQGPNVSKMGAYYWYGGLDISKLNKEQRAAYELLKAETERYAYTKVENIAITSSPKTMKKGETIRLNHKVTPATATRNGVVWESSDKSVATVNKFGEVTAHKAGEVTINLYSWDDAWPVATGKKGGYKQDGMKSSITIAVQL
ncbi:MAG: sulfatase-like hydrolase/transferase [Rikenellaceae bacterium]